MKDAAEAIRLMCSRSMGVMDKQFLCVSIGTLLKGDPLRVAEKDSVAEVLAVLKKHRAGCVIVTNQDGKVTGIFSERDFVLKCADHYESVKGASITEFMTKDPITQPPEATVAFALNLMSQGGFRHIPVIDVEGTPLGLLSVKQIVDSLVQRLTDDLLSLEV